jgi:transposase-like protein
MSNGRFPDPQSTWSEKEARVALAEWRRSGEPLAAFARKHGVAEARLYWWRKRLGPQRENRRSIISLVPAAVISRDEVVATIRTRDGLTIELANATPAQVAAVANALEGSAS